MLVDLDKIKTYLRHTVLVGSKLPSCKSTATSITSIKLPPNPFLLQNTTSMAQQTTPQENFFPKIGEIAEHTGEDASSKTGDPDNEEKVVQEIESLCMECHQQVSSYLTRP